MHFKNLLNIANAVLFANIFNKKTPINIMWRITNKCNYRCSYCEIWRERHKDLNTNQILSLIDQMTECGTQRIGFVGGEAFLRRDFEQIVDYVKEKGIYVTLVSNGSLVSSNIRIVKKLDCLVLSFDGRKGNHEKGRCRGSFDNVIKAFKICKKNKIKLITITVLNKYNLNDIDYVLDMARKYRFKSNFHLLQGKADCYPSNNQYKNAINYLIKRKKNGAPILSSLKTLKFLKDWSDYKKFITRRNPNKFKCWGGELIFNIDTDGKIAACDILTHMLKNNPSCIDLGFEKAFKLVRKNGCKACTCAQYIDYNYMFSLSPSVIFDWIKFIFNRR